MKSCQVWVVYDGKMGHLSQSLGLAQYLAEVWPLNIEIIKAKPKHNLFRKLALWGCHLMAKLQGAPFLAAYVAKMIAQLYTISPSGKKPDLIISFGGKVVPLTAALKNLYHCRNLVIGNRYGLPESLFSAMVGARAEPLANHIDTPLPFVRQIQPASDINEQQKLQRLKATQSPLWLLLIGGDGSGYHYSVLQWWRLIIHLQQLAEKQGIRWLVSTSRRTPLEVESMLTNGPLTDCAETIVCYHSQDTEIKTLMLAADRIFVTEDSLSMISEAVSCNVPVTTLYPQGFNAIPGVHQQTLEAYQRLQLIDRMDWENVHNFQPAAERTVHSYREFICGVAQDISHLPALAAIFSDTPELQPEGFQAEPVHT